MKKIVLIVFMIFATGVAFSQVNWISFESAMDLAKKDGKPVLVDVYTDWCGWCKRLDATTYSDSAIISYINEHFHAVKFNAETINPIRYRDSTYVSHGKTHDLAVQLLSGRLSYPTTVFIVDKINMVAPIPGYLTRDNIQPYLFYFGEQVYNLNNTWEIFLKGFTTPKL